jgi:hypothetical protein
MKIRTTGSFRARHEKCDGIQSADLIRHWRGCSATAAEFIQIKAKRFV